MTPASFNRQREEESPGKKKLKRHRYIQDTSSQVLFQQFMRTDEQGEVAGAGAGGWSWYLDFCQWQYIPCSLPKEYIAVAECLAWERHCLKNFA
jgi:hypothetical protein